MLDPAADRRHQRSPAPLRGPGCTRGLAYAWSVQHRYLRWLRLPPSVQQRCGRPGVHANIRGHGDGGDRILRPHLRPAGRVQQVLQLSGLLLRCDSGRTGPAAPDGASGSLRTLPGWRGAGRPVVRPQWVLELLRLGMDRDRRRWNRLHSAHAVVAQSPRYPAGRGRLRVLRRQLWSEDRRPQLIYRRGKSDHRPAADRGLGDPFRRSDPPPCPRLWDAKSSR